MPLSTQDPSASAGPELHTLVGLFPNPASEEIARAEVVRAEEVPSPYRELLVHPHHMTVTVEQHHQSKVDVRILARRQEGNSYARKILLVRQRDGLVVQFGIVRIHLDQCPPPVRQRILEGKTPLGRILIEHDVLRRIEPTQFLRILPGKAMQEWFGLREQRPTYGRLALIHCNDQPTVELLEIVAPEP